MITNVYTHKWVPSQNETPQKPRHLLAAPLTPTTCSNTATYRSTVNICGYEDIN